MSDLSLLPSISTPLRARLKEASELARQARLAALAGDHQAADQLRGAFDAIFDELEAKLESKESEKRK
jgi:hypothetical protein